MGLHAGIPARGRQTRLEGRQGGDRGVGQHRTGSAGGTLAAGPPRRDADGQRASQDCHDHSRKQEENSAGTNHQRRPDRIPPPASDATGRKALRTSARPLAARSLC
jgi:hypothetical protein